MKHKQAAEALSFEVVRCRRYLTGMNCAGCDHAHETVSQCGTSHGSTDDAATSSADGWF